jgi:hypothetical protein
MSLEAGRSQLYSALKTLQARWDAAEPLWHDVMKVQFVEQVLTPLQDLGAAALKAVDQMDVILRQMRRDCEGESFDVFAGE